jgi:hypothetical protein
LYLHSEEAVSMTLAHSKALSSRLSGQLIGQRFAKLGARAHRVLLQGLTVRAKSQERSASVPALLQGRTGR